MTRVGLNIRLGRPSEGYRNDLCGSIYAASSAKPTDKNTLAFLTWILADGQQFLNKNGYSDLASVEIADERQRRQVLPLLKKPLGFLDQGPDHLVVARWQLHGRETHGTNQEN